MKSQVRQLVAGIEPVDQIETEHRADALAWIDSGAEIFRLAKPATPPKHLVSYCLLVDIDTEHALLVDHRDAGIWLPTGGHVDIGEHPAATARREIAEELQIWPDFSSVVGDRPLFVTVTKTAGRSERHTDVSLWFIFEGSIGDDISPDDREFHGARWWLFADINAESATPFDPHLPRCIDKLRLRTAA